MAAMEDDNELPDEIINSLEVFYRSMNAVEEGLEPILGINKEDTCEKLNVLDRAKLDLMIVYAMNSMFWIYLVTQGINPKEHAIKHELDRIKNYMGKIKEVGEKKKASLQIDKDAAKRFVKSALWQPSDKEAAKDSNQTDSKKVTESRRSEKRKKQSSSERKKKHKAD